MKKVILTFSSVTSMTEFILTQRLSQIETNCKQLILKGLMSNENVAIARKVYKAKLTESSKTPA
jgi:hypothetical protein